MRIKEVRIEEMKILKKIQIVTLIVNSLFISEFEVFVPRLLSGFISEFVSIISLFISELVFFIP